MINRKNNLSITILCMLVISFILYFILKNLVDLLFNYNNNTVNNTIVSSTYIDLNTPVYTNSEYKKNISCTYMPQPTPDDGVRVNYYNSDLGNPLYPYN